MPNLTTRRRAGLLSIAITLLTYGFCDVGFADTAGSSAVDEKSVQQNPPEPGDVGIILSRAPDGGVCGSWQHVLRATFFPLGPNERILSINGTYTKGRSLSELEKLLHGKAGEPVKLRVLTLDSGECNEHLLTMKSVVNPHIYGPMLGSADSFDRPQLFGKNAKMVAMFCHLGGADQYAAALYIDILKGQPYRRQRDRNDLKIESLPDAIKFFDAVGLFDQSDAAVEQAEAIANETGRTFSENDLRGLLEAATYLGRTGRADKSERIFQGLRARIGDGIPSQKQLLLSSYAAFLKEARGALPVYEELDAFLYKHNVHSWADLHEVAEFYYAFGDFAKAEKAYRRVVNPPGKDGGLGAPVGLARSLLAQSKSAEALSVLSKAKADFKKRFNDEQITELERAVSPSLSDLEISLGNCYLALDQNLDAKNSFESAINRIELTLGEDSPCLKEPLAHLARVDRRLGENTEADALQKREERLRGLSGTDTLVSTDWYEARKAYDQLGAGSASQAERTLGELIDVECNRAEHEPDSVNRLINLSKLCFGKTNPSKLRQSLERLMPLAESPMLRPTKLYLLGELAFLSDSLGENQEDAWIKFEQCLSDFQNREYPRLNDQNRSKAEIEGNEMQRIRYHALVYAFGGEPAKAERMLKRLIGRFPQPGYGKSVLLGQLALAQLQNGEAAACSGTLDNAFGAVPPRLGTEFYDKVVQIADGYYTRGQGSESIRILNGATSSLTTNGNSLIPNEDMLIAKLGEIENNLGHYAQAEETLRRGKLEGAFPHREIVEELGRSLEMQKKFSEALALYINTAKTARRFGKPTNEFNPLERALKLIDQGTAVNPEDVTALIGISTKQRGLIADPIFLKQVLDITKSRDTKDSRIPQLERLLAEYYSGTKDNESAITYMKSAISKLGGSPERVTYDCLLELANFQVGNKSYAEATESVLRALSLPGAAEYLRYANHPGTERASLLLSSLQAAGQDDAVEAILKKNIQVREAGSAKTGDLALVEKGLLAEFYAKHRRVPESQRLVADVLNKLDTVQGEICQKCDALDPGSVVSVMLWVIDGYLESGSVAEAEGLAKRLLAIQQRWLGEKNPQFVETYLRLAAVYRSKKQVDSRGAVLLKGLDIACWNFGSQSRRTVPIRVAMADWLREKGRNDEAEKVSTLHQILADSPADKALYGPDYVYRSHSPPPATYADSAEGPLKDWLRDTIVASGEGSAEAEQVLNRLVKFYRDRSKFATAEEYLLRKLRTAEFIEGRSSRKRSACMCELATLSDLNGKHEEGLSWLKKAEDADLNLNSERALPKDLMRYASTHLQLHEKSKAADLTVRAAKKFLGNPPPPFYERNNMQECVELLTKTGQLDLAAALAQKLEAMTKRQHGLIDESFNNKPMKLIPGKP